MRQISSAQQSIIAFIPQKESFNSSKIQNQEFLGAITHELKTPLNAILGFCEVLRLDIGKNYSPQQCLDSLNEINLAALEMSELIHDILDVANSASKNFSVDLSKEIAVADAVKRAVRLNYGYSLQRNVSLKTEIAADVKLIKLDEKRLKQILTNLISNAVKYSPKQSEVKITVTNFAKNNQQFLEICVADQGFGMNKEQVAKAFEKYSTIENENSESVDSFGLGLPITKQLVELQNGELEIESEINRGTKMILKFPYL